MKREKIETVEEYLARGGKITVIKTPEPAPPVKYTRSQGNDFNIISPGGYWISKHQESN